MANECDFEDPRRIWQSQPVEPVAISIDELRARAARFERRIRGRNRRETWTSAGAILIFLFYLWKFPTPLERIGSLLVIAGLAWIIYRMNGRAAAASLPDGEFESCIEFHRRELVRQRDLLRSVWRWYLAPLVPGVVLFPMATVAEKASHGCPVAWWVPVVLLAFLALCFWLVERLNRRAAACLDRAIADLDRAAGK